MSSRPGQDRPSQYKNRGSLRPEDHRRRRDEQLVEIRRQTRLNNLSKRRNLDDVVIPSFDGNLANNDKNDSIVESHDDILKDVAAITAGIVSDDIRAQYESTITIRKYISRAENPPIQCFVDAGVVPRLVSFLESPNSDLVFEAAWALTNIASGDSTQTTCVVEAGAVPVFIRLLSSPLPQVAEQAAWALGNVAGESTDFRDFVLHSGVLPPLLDLVTNLSTDCISLLRTCAWLLDNLCRGKAPPPPWEIISQALPTICKLLYLNESGVIVDLCWALSYMTEGGPMIVNAVLDTGIGRRLVELLKNTQIAVVTPALRTVGNIVTGSDNQTQMMLNAGILPALHRLLFSSSELIVKEACWVVSNITAGRVEQIREVLDAGILPRLVSILETGDLKSKREACWAISNAAVCSGNYYGIVECMLNDGAIAGLCKILTPSFDFAIIQIALDAIEKLLMVDEEQSGNSRSSVALAFEAANGVQKLVVLLQAGNEKIFNKASAIMDTYFSSNDELIINNPNISNNNPSQFSFAPNSDLDWNLKFT